MTPKVLYQFKQCAGESFRPSNGTEGMIFQSAFCDRCIHENYNPQTGCGKHCEVLTATMLFDERDAEYPKEWRFDSDGWPVCTKWVKWDWNNDGDPDDPDNPLAPPPPPDPNQLDLFPLYPNDTTLEQKPSQQEKPLISLLVP